MTLVRACVFAMLFCRAAAGAPLPGEAAYLAGYNALADQRLAEAATQFAAAKQAGGPLVEFAQVRAWEAGWLQNDASAEQAAWAYVHQGPTGAARDLCTARLGIHLAHSGRAAEAAALLMPLVEVDPAPWWMDASFAEAGNALLQAGGAQLVTAYACFDKIVQRPGYVPQRNDAARKLKDSPDPTHRLHAALALFRAGGFDEAEKIVASTPLELHGSGGGGVALDAFELALAVATGKPGEQAGVQEVLAANKANPCFPLLVSRVVRKNFKAGNVDGAQGLAAWLFEAFPDNREAGDSVWFIAQALEAKDPATALALYDHIAATAPGYWRSTNAANEIVQYWLAQGKLTEAQAAAESLGTRFPESKFRAENYYELALRWRAAGDEKTAMRDYLFAVNSGPGDYFAHRALQQLEDALPEKARPAAAPVNLKIDGSTPVLQPMPGLLAKPPALPAQVESDPRIQCARFFGRSGMEEAEWVALSVARGLGATSADTPWYLALADAGVGFTAQQWADKRKWGYDGGTRTLARWRLEFPRPYFDEYQRLAKQLGMDPYFLLSISRQESTFRASIVSRSGAVGVMQLMPATAKWMTTNTPGVTMDNATHLALPGNSLLLGSNYLSQMMNKFGGNMLYAAAAYNAGPGNVNKWLKATPAAPPDVFVDIIPLEETRGYVRKVLGNLAAYRSLYPAEPAP